MRQVTKNTLYFLSFAIFAVLAFYGLPALSQATPTPVPSVVPTQGLSPEMQAAVQTAVAAALAAGKNSLLQSVTNGTLHLTAPLVAQVSAIALALHSLISLLTGLVALAQGKTITTAGIGPAVTAGSPAPAAAPASSSVWTKILGGAFFVLKLVSGNL